MRKVCLAIFTMEKKLNEFPLNFVFPMELRYGIIENVAEVFWGVYSIENASI